MEIIIEHLIDNHESSLKNGHFARNHILRSHGGREFYCN